MLLKGQISHHLPLQSDDQVHYVIKIVPGSVVSIESNISPSTTVQVLFRLTHIGGSIATSVFVPGLGAVLLASTDRVAEAVELVRQNIVGGWDAVARSLIALIGIFAADEYAVVNEPPPPPSFIYVRRYFKADDHDWVTVGVESTDRDMIRCGYQDRKKQFLAPTSPGPDTIRVYRWYHPTERDWVTLPEDAAPDATLEKWGYREKTFSFYAYRNSAADRIAVNRWHHAGDHDWVTIAEGEVLDGTLTSWGYDSKTHVCFGKRLQ